MLSTEFLRTCSKLWRHHACACILDKQTPMLRFWINSLPGGLSSYDCFILWDQNMSSGSYMYTCLKRLFHCVIRLSLTEVANHMSSWFRIAKAHFGNWKFTSHNDQRNVQTRRTFSIFNRFCRQDQKISRTLCRLVVKHLYQISFRSVQGGDEKTYHDTTVCQQFL